MAGVKSARTSDKPYMDISSIALTGLQNAQNRFDRAAAAVTRASSNPEDVVDLSRQTVEMLAAKNQFSASVRVARVADEMQKSLLDMLI